MKTERDLSSFIFCLTEAIVKYAISIRDVSEKFSVIEKIVTEIDDTNAGFTGNSISFNIVQNGFQ